MEEIEVPISFKKMIIFGRKGSGKSYLTKNLEKHIYRCEEFPNESNLLNFFYF